MTSKHGKIILSFFFPFLNTFEPNMAIDFKYGQYGGIKFINSPREKRILDMVYMGGESLPISLERRGFWLG